MKITVGLFLACFIGVFVQSCRSTAADSNLNDSQHSEIAVSSSAKTWEGGTAPSEILPVTVSHVADSGQIDSGIKMQIALDDPSAIIVAGTATGRTVFDDNGTVVVKVDNVVDFYLETKKGDTAENLVRALVEKIDSSYKTETKIESDGSVRLKFIRNSDDDGKSYGDSIPESLSLSRKADGRLFVQGATTTLPWHYYAKCAVVDRVIEIAVISYHNERGMIIYDSEEFSIDVTPPAKSKIVLKGKYLVRYFDQNRKMIYESEVDL